MKTFLSLLGLALVLAGCAETRPIVGPLPYQFSIGGVSDARAKDHDDVYDQYPLDAQWIAAGFRRALPQSVYAGRQATVWLKVIHYEATASGDSYAVSIAARAHAVDDSPHPNLIADTTLKCSSVNGHRYAAVTYAKAIWKDKTLNPLTPGSQDETMLRQEVGNCVRELAYQFAQAVANQRPNGAVMR